MVFASPVFLIFFLPIVLLGSCLLRGKIRNLWIFAASIIFYAWGGTSYTILLLVSTVVNYLLGLAVDKEIVKKGLIRKLFCGIAVVWNLGILIFFKYLNFAVDNILKFFDLINFEVNWDVPVIALPIGISFFTFQILSYVIDVYRGDVKSQKNPINVGMYIFLFPQLIAGPIVRYVDIQKEIECPNISVENFRAGFIRFVVGLGKKVIIANSMGAMADEAFNNPELLDMPTAWIGMIAYMLQIYYDFSAYSDMAIGLGSCMGFTFLENFNYPYISKSIKEFWRRWHISLSTWFRDYIYIPLGGSKKGKYKTFRNLLIVFFTTGLWHGASWNFIVWGLYYGLFLLLERTEAFQKIYAKCGDIWKRVYTLLVVMIGWVFFRAETLSAAGAYLKELVSFDFSNWNRIPMAGGNSQWIYMCIAIIFSGPIMLKIKEVFAKAQNKGGNLGTVLLVAQDICVIAILFLCMSYLASSGFNPFIYFKF